MAVLTARRPDTQTSCERLPLLTLLPALGTSTYYLLPAGVQGSEAVQVLPQLHKLIWPDRTRGV